MIRYGDLQLLPNNDEYLIIACDSSGAIGNKDKDIIKIQPELAGFFAAFVPLVEVLATKGTILSIVDTLCVEMDPTGKRIISGIKEALTSVGLDSNLLTGSTEDNVPTSSTGIGVTVIGSILKQDIEIKSIPLGSDLVLLGIPKVGQEFLDEEVVGNARETLTLELMTLLNSEEMVLDMIPVGSKGISYEAGVLASRHNREINLNTSLNIDYNKSAGPSTCLLVAVNHNVLESFINKYNQIPINLIAIFE